MDYQRPDPEQGSSQYSARVEDDFVRPLQPMKSVSYRRLPAALPFALAGILVVSSVAFGAAVIRNAITPPPDASGVVVGDESAVPSVGVSVAPESQAPESVAPAPTPLTLEVSISGGQVALAWTRYQGEDFACYKVVRSTDATVSWPLGEGDTLVAAISDIDKLSTVDAAPTGQTFTYEVFAVKSSDDNYAMLVGSNVVTIAVPVPTPTPKPTPKPTQNCSMSLSFKIETIGDVGGIQPAVVGSHAPATKVTFTWTKYKCDHFEWYVLVKSPDATIVVPVSTSSNDEPSEITQNVNQTSTSVNLGPGTYYFLVMAWNSNVLCYGGAVLAKTNVVKVVIP